MLKILIVILIISVLYVNGTKNNKNNNNNQEDKNSNKNRPIVEIEILPVIDNREKKEKKHSKKRKREEMEGLSSDFECEDEELLKFIDSELNKFNGKKTKLNESNKAIYILSNIKQKYKPEKKSSNITSQNIDVVNILSSMGNNNQSPIIQQFRSYMRIILKMDYCGETVEQKRKFYIHSYIWLKMIENSKIFNQQEMLTKKVEIIATITVNTKAQLIKLRTIKVEPYYPTKIKNLFKIDEKIIKSFARRMKQYIVQNKKRKLQHISQNNNWINQNRISQNNNWINQNRISQNNNWINQNRISQNNNWINQNRISQNNNWINQNRISQNNNWINQNDIINNNRRLQNNKKLITLEEHKKFEKKRQNELDERIKKYQEHFVVRLNSDNYVVHKFLIEILTHHRLGSQFYKIHKANPCKITLGKKEKIIRGRLLELGLLSSTSANLKVFYKPEGTIKILELLMKMKPKKEQIIKRLINKIEKEISKNTNN